MTTDNKTLADVQPGGRVRLGDGLPPLPEPRDMGYTTDSVMRTYTMTGYTAEQMQDYARAALSAQLAPVHQIDAETLWWLQDAINTMAEGGNQSHARFLQSLHDSLSVQPSPGGQGDTLEDEARRMFEAQADSLAAPWSHQWEPTKEHWRKAALAARQPVGEPVEATDAMVEAALQSTVANNASPWRQVVASEDHADFISDMRAAINAALAARPSPITAEATTTSTQTVPDHCDRIFWQHNYYQLPVWPTDQKKPTKRSTSPPMSIACAMC
ncbi:hypothetical protein JY419_02220 [Stenotrophomonas maltophilia]|nr:hypothetical protein [Stenotrophomonas maltophilia]